MEASIVLEASDVEASNVVETSIVNAEWLEDAKRLIDLDYLFNKLHEPSRGGFLKFWRRFANDLDLDGENDEETMKNLFNYIATTAPDQRCPCKQDEYSLHLRDHFPGCDELRPLAVLESSLFSISLMRKRLAREIKYMKANRITEGPNVEALRKAEDQAILLKRKEIRDRRREAVWLWRKKRENAQMVGQLWDSRLPNYMSTPKLEEMKKDIEDWLKDRYHLHLL